MPLRVFSFGWVLLFVCLVGEYSWGVFVGFVVVVVSVFCFFGFFFLRISCFQPCTLPVQSVWGWRRHLVVEPLPNGLRTLTFPQHWMMWLWKHSPLFSIASLKHDIRFPDQAIAKKIRTLSFEFARQVWTVVSLAFVCFFFFSYLTLIQECSFLIFFLLLV